MKPLNTCADSTETTVFPFQPTSLKTTSRGLQWSTYNKPIVIYKFFENIIF